MDKNPESDVLNLLETKKEPNMTKEQLERNAEEINELEQKIAKELGSWKHAVLDGGDQLTVVTPEKSTAVPHLCRGCGRLRGSAHTCNICGYNRPLFCGRGIGEEGNEQIIQHQICDIDSSIK